MKTIPSRLLGLVVLGTILKRGEVVGQHPEITPLLLETSPSTSAPWGCGPPEAVNVRFYEIKVPDSDVVYRRLTADNEENFFAIENATIVSSSSDIVSCAKAAGKGFDAFSWFQGDCVVYHLKNHYAMCQTGYYLYFVRTDIIADVSVVPLDEAPYIIFSNPARKTYMMTTVVDVDPTNPHYQSITAVGSDDKSYFFFPNGGPLIEIAFAALDMNHCLNNCACGSYMIVATEHIENPLDATYLLNECGNTIQVSNARQGMKMAVYSHEGLGCQYYPSDVPDECTVTFTVDASSSNGFAYGFYLSENEDGCAGLDMTVTGSSSQGGPSETADACDSTGNALLNGYDTYTISVSSHPSKRAVGFIGHFL